MNMKDYQATENARNKANARLYTEMMKVAFGTNSVMIGHHLSFEFAGDISTENEIPSADTLIFDHAAMRAIFGPRSIEIMQHLAAVDCDGRDEVLKGYYEDRHGVLSACSRDIDFNGEDYIECEQAKRRFEVDDPVPSTQEIIEEIARDEGI